jgi:beta-N-acetylhexosaminidase
MAATLKHFPGHGSVLEDTHVAAASDPRALDELRALDLLPFAAGIDAGADAVMMAHVVYPQVAPEPAGYSPRWIQQILRGEMGFRGVVFSDDIGMAGSFSVGGVQARVHAHLDAGVRCRAGLPPGAGRRGAARRRGPPTQYCRAARPDRPRRTWLGRPAG